MNIATTLGQSRHLAELIPHDSADMCYEKLAIGNIPQELQYRLCLTPFKFYSGIGVPAWSLSALLELMPETIKAEPSVSTLKKIAKAFDVPLSLLLVSFISKDDFPEDKQILYPILEQITKELYDKT